MKRDDDNHMSQTFPKIIFLIKESKVTLKCLIWYLTMYLIIYMQINIIRITAQLQYFRQYQQRVSALIGEKQAQDLVNQALVLITLGGNDFVNNYYLVPFSARSREFALPDYVVFLISEYRKILVVFIIPILLLHLYYIFLLIEYSVTLHFLGHMGFS